MSPRGSHVNLLSVGHRYGFRSPNVLDDVSLTIEPGQMVALIGRSGCGKSTLLQLMAGLARPTDGYIFIDGTIVKRPSPRWNVMFQKPSLYPWMTVEKNATFGCLLANERESGRQRVRELLEMVGIADLADENVQRLSGGQQQRVALARSLATQPELLLLDEPFAALDEVTRAALQKDVLRIAAQLEITLVIVTHDIDEALTMANRIVVMSSNPGRIVADLENDGEETEALKQTIRTHLNDDESRDGFAGRGQQSNKPNTRNHVSADETPSVAASGAVEALMV